MLGLLSALFMGTVTVGNIIREETDNAYCRKNNVSKDGWTYVNSRGETRLVSNDHLAMYTTVYKDNEWPGTRKGDWVLHEIGGKRVLVHNFGNEQRDSMEALDKRLKEERAQWWKEELKDCPFDFVKKDAFRGTLVRSKVDGKIYNAKEFNGFENGDDKTLWRQYFLVDTETKSPKMELNIAKNIKTGEKSKWEYGKYTLEEVDSAIKNRGMGKSAHRHERWCCPYWVDIEDYALYVFRLGENYER